MANPTLGGFADISRYVQSAAQPQPSALDSLIQGFGQGQYLQNLPAQLQQSRQDALNNQLLGILKQAQIRQALTQQGIFVPTAAQNGTPASIPAIPLTAREQMTIAPYLPRTPEEVAAQKPVEVPFVSDAGVINGLQEVRPTIPLGGGAFQVPQIAQENLNNAIQKAAAQKQNEALGKPIAVGKDKSIVIPRGASGQSEVLYAPPEPEVNPNALNDNQFKQLNVIQDNMRLDPDIKNYAQIKGEQQRMEAAQRVGEQTNNYFGVDLALADQFIRGVNGNFAIRQGTQKILLSEQPLVNRLLGNMRALVLGQGGQGFTTEDRKQLIELSKAFRNTAEEEYRTALTPYLAQADAVKIPHKFLPGANISENNVQPIGTIPAQPGATPAVPPGMKLQRNTVTNETRIVPQ